ncbi:two-component sensor histidine kinase [Planomonospora parontospora subsp. parontospora]|uniref:histidine kinase n=2 Tax=Planomonospora parontospora TaxID=58119 RepID=A0AA37BH30_9ACTN|nr:HAMP domain-containing sensor histidine kinase [Planomonospora parontospora]GGK70995.1 two-component sensor histidine kinase [Planomonospora parontospora]GII09731.1 two-component sensor histidine kinase [Planomonospora parontospora subsp. parontospora]
MFARSPLRVRLIGIILVLLAIALVLIGVGSVSIMRGYLIDRVDTQIDLTTATMLRRLHSPGPFNMNGRALPPDMKVELRGPQGRALVTASGVDVEGRPVPAVPSEPGLEPFHRDEWRIRVTPLDTGGSILVAVDLAEVRQIVGQLALVELLGGGGLMAALALVGVVVIRRSLRPLEEIERTAEAIAAGDLSRRVPDADSRTEVGRLGRSLNGMLAQIEAAFQARSESEAAARGSEERMRRFVADASHELRTPLTSIRGFAEFYRQAPGVDAAPLMRRVESEAVRMGLLVDDLLMLARMDQQRPMSMRPVDLLAIAADAVHDARILAPERNVSLSVDGAALIVSGDEVRLRQVVGNLMNNALTHTPQGTPVRVLLRAEGGTAVVEVADEGPGLTAEQRERVFERFYRVDSARGRRAPEDGGSGLGLAIVAAMVEAHGGTVSVDSVPSEGAVFSVRLPLAPDSG